MSLKVIQGHLTAVTMCWVHLPYFL